MHTKRMRVQFVAAAVLGWAAVTLLLALTPAAQAAVLRGASGVGSTAGVFGTVLANFLVAVYEHDSSKPITTHNPNLQLLCTAPLDCSGVLGYTTPNNTETVALPAPPGASMHVTFDNQFIQIPGFKFALPEMKNGSPRFDLVTQHFWQTIDVDITTSDASYNDALTPTAYCMRLLITITWKGFTTCVASPTYKLCSDTTLVKVGGSNNCPHELDIDHDVPEYYKDLLRNGSSLDTVRAMYHANMTTEA